PLVPVDAFADPPFSLLHPEDACQAMVAALVTGYDGPLNVVGPGATSPWQATRLGGRVPVPVLSPLWGIASPIVEFAGAAIAPHVIELLRYGCVGAGGLAITELGIERPRPTQRVLQELFDWAEIVPIATARETAA